MPGGFEDAELIPWSQWVLDHALAPLPPTIRRGESVPVARWVSARYGAVLHLQSSWEHGDPDDDELNTQLVAFRRLGNTWAPFDNDGGQAWFDPFTREDLPATFNLVWASSLCRIGDWWCASMCGVCGIAARTIVVEDNQGMLRRPVESPLGAFVVCADPRLDPQLRILDGDGDGETMLHRRLAFTQ